MYPQYPAPTCVKLGELEHIGVKLEGAKPKREGEVSVTMLLQKALYDYGNFELGVALVEKGAPHNWRDVGYLTNHSITLNNTTWVKFIWHRWE